MMIGYILLNKEHLHFGHTLPDVTVIQAKSATMWIYCRRTPSLDEL